MKVCVWACAIQFHAVYKRADAYACVCMYMGASCSILTTVCEKRTYAVCSAAASRKTNQTIKKISVRK